ncbi:Transmembrane component NikQ of energizing module of nickel ECF transporter [Paramagnetospirillum magnetotacticum MS-1]|uniref:Transmembrane component NikQ of energizing module of nickel ECF transporter n=1 Tax=Paramagnetospirillum magnetotacticum MS-1 TaxID=272627 RepID=A0A0C2YTJ7_PARME|nr:cobalt ECF transporter T component CbiQ [Paramagnetospirillum magnetotacticum]KIL98020.1 Transmembrane component NikQ of energizing module of nickel ECF transporter [Paramagnetospirillum magnetotacticum MS-1]
MSLMERLDPRTRLVAALLFALAEVLVPSLAAQCAGLGLAVTAALAARLPLGATLRRLLGLEGFMAVALVMLPFTVPGQPLFSLWGLDASQEGLLRAAGIAIKANAVAVALFALLGAMEMPVLGRALGRLGVSGRFVHLFLFTTRYLSVMEEEYRRLRLAMRARAFRPRTGLHCWRSIGYLFGMLMVRSLERAERIDAAMRCRGFTGRFPTLEDDVEAGPGRVDLGFGAASAVGLALVIAVGMV